MTEVPIDTAASRDAPVTTLDADNPWPGPEAFREADAKFFFGRERARDALSRLTLQNRLVVLYGRSGLGKTSLLRAGVFPVLREALSLPVYIRLRFPASADPGSAPELRMQVKAAVEEAAADTHVETPVLDERFTLWEWFYRSDARFFNERSRRVRPVLVFDQFEEAFTHGRNTPALGAVTDRFLDELIDLVRGSVPPSVALRFEEDSTRALAFATDRDPCGVLLAFRQEFLAELLRLRPRLPTLLDHRYELWGMTIEDAERVVTGPGSHLVDPGVAALIAKFVAAARRSAEDQNTDDTTVDPAILSIFCRELNNTRQARKLPRITTDLVAGTQDAIIADFYRRCVADLPPEVHRFVEDRLVTDSGYRNSAALEEALRTPGMTKDAIDLLIQRRLVRPDGSGPRARLELTHDVLTDPIVQSRNLRRLREREERTREEQEQARRAAQDAADRERQRRELEAKRRALRTQQRLGGLLVVLVVISFTLAWTTRRASTTAQRNLASAHIEQGLGLMITARHDRGLAYIAQAIRDDPDNVNARSLAFDAILHASWPLPDAMFRHGGPALWAQFDSTGSKAVSVSRDKTARVWRVADGRPEGPPLQHGGAVFLARFGAASDTVLTAADDGYARRWDTAGGRQLAIYDHPGSQVTWATFRPGDDQVVTGAGDGTLRLWRDDGPFDIKAHNGAIVDVEFDRTGDRIVTASVDGTAAVWDSHTGHQLLRLSQHHDVVATARFSPDAQLIVTASHDGTAVVWQVRTQKPLYTLRHGRAVVSAQFNPDGTRVLTASSDTSARLWDARAGEPIGAPLVHDGPVRSAAFSPEGLRIVTVSSDQVSLWAASDGSRLAEPIHLDATAGSAVFSPDGQHVITTSADGTATVWDVRTGAAISPTVRPSCDVVSVAQLTGTVRDLAIGCSGGTITIWNAAANDIRPPISNPLWLGLAWIDFSGEAGLMLVVAGDTATLWRPDPGIVTTTLHHGALIRSAVFSPDGSRIATAGSDGKARIWDAATGHLLATVAHGGTVWNAHFNADGTRIITASADRTAQIWDARSGTRVGPTFQTDTDEMSDAQISRSGARVLISTPSRARLFDANSGARIADLAELAPVALFAPQDDVVLTVGGVSTLTLDGVSQLWDGTTGHLLATLSEKSPSLAAEFSKYGRRLVTTHANGFRLWEAQTGQPQTQALSLDYGPRQLAATRVASDGQRVATVGGDGTVRLWDVPTGSREDARPIAALVEAIVGYRLNERGAVERIEDRSAALRDARAHRSASQGLGERVRAWALGDRGSRTIGPFTDVTIDDYIRRQLASNSADAIREAQRLFPWDPRLRPASPVGSAPAASAR